MANRSKRATAAEHCRLGLFFYRSGNYDLAIEQFIAASKKAPRAPNVWLNLGVVYIDKGDLVKAMVALEKALELKPNYAPAYFHLGQLYDKRGEDEKASECFNRVIELEPRGELSRRARERLEGFHPKILGGQI
jgi:superkiller protein 3